MSPQQSLFIGAALALTLTATAQDPKVAKPKVSPSDGLLGGQVATSNGTDDGVLPLRTGSFAPRPPRGEVWFDEPTQGTLWAVADTYKASFAADGFTFIPYFGADAPKNCPLKLIVQEVRMAGTTVPLLAASPVRRGKTVQLDRGVVHEQYDLAADHVAR